MTWPKAKLGEVCRIVSGSTPRTGTAEYWDGDIAWVTPKDLSNQTGMYINKSAQQITKQGYESCSTELLPAGSVLLSSRAPIGYVAINSIPMCTNQGFKSFIPNKARLHSEYLYFWLRANRNYLQSLGNGATFKEISKAIVERIEMPLPPVAEQKRTAAILDQADALRRKRREAISKLDTLLQSVFLEMFGDPGTNSKGWEKATIGDLVEDVSYGTSSKAGSEGEFPILRMGNITYNGSWDFSELKYIDFTTTEQSKYLVSCGDILFNRTNSKELVGKTAVYRQGKPMAYAGYLIRVRSKPEHSSEYISAYLNSVHGKMVLRNMCKSIIGMANINATELKSISIQVPPSLLQREYENKVAAILALREQSQFSLNRLEALFTTIQQQSFHFEPISEIAIQPPTSSPCLTLDF